jgi:PAS domain S-box-containing protein
MSRLQAINARVSQISSEGGISARLTQSARQDEFNDLVVSINGMLEALEHAETGMRESEERYRLLFERAPDAIIIIGVEGDDAGRIIAANQAAAVQHGYTVEELCRLQIYDLNTDETNKIAGEIAASVVAGDWVTAELWHRKKDGSPFPIEVHAGVIKIDGKDYILGFDRDITQRKIAEDAHHQQHERIRKLNDELNQKALELAAANDELETFNYSVSHDMRGPLTRISGYCQLLLDDEVCNQVPHFRDYITRIYDSEIWLNGIIDALLNLAQLTRVEIVASPVDLSAISEAILSELALESPERTVAIRVEPGIFVSGDARLLKMVMVNLLGNSWKYSSNRSDALIEFGANFTDAGPVYFVRDNGAGFDMKEADKLFRAFTRLHDISQFEGTGIGLATVQRIISRHGGKIWAEAVPGAGATFYFTLQSSHST